MPMTSSRLRCKLIVLLVLAIVTVFFFPSSLGAYSVVHGPATVFQGARTAARAYASIGQAALVVVRITLVLPLVVLARLEAVKAMLHQLSVRGKQFDSPLLILICCDCGSCLPFHQSIIMNFGVYLQCQPSVLRQRAIIATAENLVVVARSKIPRRDSQGVIAVTT